MKPQANRGSRCEQAQRREAWGAARNGAAPNVSRPTADAVRLVRDHAEAAIARTIRPGASAWLLVIIAALSTPARGVDFAHEVVPILRKHCGECHTGDARQGGFSLNTREDLLTGGDSGTPGVVPGSSTTSELMARITSDDPDDRMPSEGEPLPPDAIAVLKAWIDEQAPWEPGFAFKGTAWEPPLALREVVLPPAADGRTNPVDRVVDAALAAHGVPRPPRCDDRTFIRRASLDLVGLLPGPDRVEAFVADTDPGKHARLVRDLLADDVAYADHWLTFWNDLLRNDYTGTGYITGGRRQITTWLHRALAANVPFDRFVRELVSPADESRGFIDGIVWRGTVNASQAVPIQFAQNVGQTFLGINLKCASCHDSFVDRWTLRQTYDLAAIAAEQPLELARCDKATGVMATPAWIFPNLGQIDASLPSAARLAQLAALMTQPGNGWLSRTLANRFWHRLMGRGIVHPVESLRTQPWSEDLLDLLAGDLVSHGWDMRHLLETICTSEAYAAVTPAVEGLPRGGDYVFRGPLPRRMTAEQFTDAVWTLAGTAPAKPDAEVVRFDQDSTPSDLHPAATWIWSNEAAESPPEESLTFSKDFELPQPAVHAAVVLAADNSATLFINGKSVVTGNDWQQPVMAVATADLKEGANTVIVTAANAAAGGPAALRMEIRCRLADGTVQTIVTDGSWKWTKAKPDAKGQFPKDTKPTDWAPATVVANQATWATADAPFAAHVIAATAPASLPMVRAGLVKATPLMAALGRPNRDQVVTSRPSDLTTLEAILLANDRSLADEIAKGGSRILAKHGPDPDRVASWIFTAALSRPPTADEAAVARDLLGAAPTAESVADCLWSVVMLPEFQLVR